MRSGDLKKAKRAVRRSVLAARDALSLLDREALDTAIAARVMALDEITRARTVMVFWSFGSEVSTRPLIEALSAAGIAVALPRIDGPALQVRTFAPGDPVAPTAFGAMEPTAGVVLQPADLDVIITPAVAFDPDGHRVGYGGGFYDRLFPRAPGAARIGIAYDLQVLDGPLPVGSFDLPVHVIVTQSRTLRCSPST